MLCYMYIITAGLEYLRSACKVSVGGLKDYLRFVKLHKGHLRHLSSLIFIFYFVDLLL